MRFPISRLGLKLVLWSSLIVFLFLNLALAKVVVIPLRRLSRTMEEVEERGLEVEVTVPSKDEMGQLAASFRRMLELFTRLIGGDRPHPDRCGDAGD